MSNPLHAAYYADHAVHQVVEIVENVQVAKETFRVRLAAPVLARRIVPGQFLMLRLGEVNDPLIGRPLALYDTVISASGDAEAIDVVYLVKGKLTSRLWQMGRGQKVEVWGPLGNGFFQETLHATTHNSSLTLDDSTHLVMVAGGIGYTPFFALAQEALGRNKYGDPPRALPRVQRITFCYGARTADYLAGVEDFERLGIEVRLATDDGSFGYHGFVTDVLKQVLAEQKGKLKMVCCGPEPMMKAVAQISRTARVPCEISLETPMACGVGICFTCVAKVRLPEGGWDYKRTCVEGPVFDAETIEW
jgi:dihydroorotate dehydrogenase electron transfer subunit